VKEATNYSNNNSHLRLYSCWSGSYPSFVINLSAAEIPLSIRIRLHEDPPTPLRVYSLRRDYSISIFLTANDYVS
jgi:hypothetical protein